MSLEKVEVRGKSSLLKPHLLGSADQRETDMYVDRKRFTSVYERRYEGWIIDRCKTALVLKAQVILTVKYSLNPLNLCYLLMGSESTYPLP